MRKNKASFFTILLVIIAGLLSIIAIYLRNIFFELRSPKKPYSPKFQDRYFSKEATDDSLTLKLSAKRAVIQLNELLPQVHLTLISVLQGLALGILITQIEEHFLLSIGNILLYLNSSLLIVLIWYLYTSVFVTFMWPFSFRSTLLQFLLTGAQGFSFVNIHQPGIWTMGIAITAFIGGVIRLNNTRIARPEMYERRDIFTLDISTEHEASVMFFILGFIFAVVALFQLTYPSQILNIAVGTVILLTILYLITLSRKTQTTLMNMYFENSPWAYEAGLAFEKDTSNSNPKVG